MGSPNTRGPVGGRHKQADHTQGDKETSQAQEKPRGRAASCPSGAVPGQDEAPWGGPGGSRIKGPQAGPAHHRGASELAKLCTHRVSADPTRPETIIPATWGKPSLQTAQGHMAGPRTHQESNLTCLRAVLYFLQSAPESALPTLYEDNHTSPSNVIASSPPLFPSSAFWLP